MLSSTDTSLVMAPLNGFNMLRCWMGLFHEIMVNTASFVVVVEIVVETSHPIRHSLGLPSIGPISFKESTFQIKVIASLGLSNDSQKAY